MANGDCPVGAANKAYINTLQKGVEKLSKKQDDICGKIDGIRETMKSDMAELRVEVSEFKLSFKTWVITLMVSLLLLLVGVVANLVMNYFKLTNGGA